MSRVLVLALVCVGFVSGCGPTRHGVVEPERVATLNSSDWNVKSAPAAADPGVDEDVASQP